MSRGGRIFGEAWGALVAHKPRAFFMMAGVVVGIASLTAVICVAQGTKKHLMGIVAKHGLDMIMVRPGGTKQVFAPGTDRNIVSLTEPDVHAIESSIRNVAQACGVQNQRGWEIQFGNNSVKTRMFGVGANWADIRRREVARGEFLSHEDLVHASKVCVIGILVKQALFGEAEAVGQDVRMGAETFRVKGVFAEVGATAEGRDADDRVVVPLTTAAKRLLGRPYLEQVVVQVRDVGALKQTAEEIRALLRERHRIAAGGEDDFFVREPEDVKEAATAQSSTLSALLLAVSGVALLVGGVVIMNIMLMSVSQRRAEIGLRRAVGARRGDIAGQFLMESLSVAVVGGLVGSGLGVAGSWVLSRVRPDTFIEITWVPFAVAVSACGLLAVLFGLYPARKAAVVDPVVALRDGKI